MVLISREPNSHAGLRAKKFGVDLNFMVVFTGNFPSLTILGNYCEFWKDAFRAGNGLRPLDQLLSHRGSLLGGCAGLDVAQH